MAKQTRDFGPMLGWWCPIVYDDGPTSAQLSANGSCFLMGWRHTWISVLFFSRLSGYLGMLWCCHQPRRETNINPPRAEYFCLNHRDQRVFQFENIINVLVGSIRFIWIPLLWVYGHYKYLQSFSAGIDCRRQVLTSTDVRFSCPKTLKRLKHTYNYPLYLLHLCCIDH